MYQVAYATDHVASLQVWPPSVAVLCGENLRASGEYRPTSPVDSCKPEPVYVAEQQGYAADRGSSRGMSLYPVTPVALGLPGIWDSPRSQPCS